MAEQPLYALRFISGKYQGGEFPLAMGAEIVIGRSSDLDMVLVEDMVSRKHAKISTMNEQIIIQDLGSTNGTFVNGEKIKRVRLREGDRILIGTSIVKLVTLDSKPTGGGLVAAATDAPAGEPRVPRKGEMRATSTSTRSMAGTIDEIPLPDLLQLLSTSRKSGVLEIGQSEGQMGRIYLRDGQIYHAAIEGAPIPARKAIYRMLVWQSGAFELRPPDAREFDDKIDEPVEGLLMEAMRQLDEIRRVQDELPAPTAKIQLAKPLGRKLRDLAPEQLDVIQLAHESETINEVLNQSPKSDLDTYSALLALFQAKVLVEAPTDGEKDPDTIKES